MTTNVDKSFEGPSRFSAMADHFKTAQEDKFSFAGQTKTVGGGRFSAMRNHLIDSANAEAARTPVKVHPDNPRYNPKWR